MGRGGRVPSTQAAIGLFEHDALIAPRHLSERMQRKRRKHGLQKFRIPAVVIFQQGEIRFNGLETEQIEHGCSVTVLRVLNQAKTRIADFLQQLGRKYIAGIVVLNLADPFGYRLATQTVDGSA